MSAHLEAWPQWLTKQELGQSGISLIKKSQLKAKFEKLQKELLAQQKAKLAADQKMVSCETPTIAFHHGKS